MTVARRFIAGSHAEADDPPLLNRIASATKPTKEVRRDALPTVGQPSRLAPADAASPRSKAGRLTYVGQPSRLALSDITHSIIQCGQIQVPGTANGFGPRCGTGRSASLRRHFVPGYYQPVPPGQKPLAHRRPSH
jgi:hypothetical protein